MTVIFGINNQANYSVGTTKNALGAVAYEEQSAGTGGSGLGWGQRLGSRDYSNHPSEVMATGSSALTQFNGGRQILASVSNGYSHASNAAGSHDSEWNAMFDRLFALGFNATDTSGAGTKKPKEFWLCIEHEVDRPDKAIPTADFISSWKHIRALRDARATANGKDKNLVKMVFCVTAYGMNVGRVAPFWPGNDQVDYLAVDTYNGLNGAAWREMSSNMQKSHDFNAAHGNKKLIIAETASVQDANDTTRVGTYYSNAATYVNNHPEIIAVFVFQGVPGSPINTDKSAHPYQHEAIRLFIASVGGYAGYQSGGTGQLAPTSPTGLAFVSDADGTGGTLTWNAPPTADNVTGWDLYQAAGKVTTGFQKITVGSPVSATPRSFHVSGLTPGTDYSFTAVAINAVDRSGFGTIVQATTILPGTVDPGGNQAPTINAASYTIDTVDPTLVHLSSSSSDADGQPVTSTWTIVGAQGFLTTATGDSPNVQLAPGSYAATLAATDGTDTTRTTIPVVVPTLSSTQNYGWPLPQPGDDVRNWAPLMRGILPDVDYQVKLASNLRAPGNTVHKLIGSTYDPVYSGTSFLTTTAGDFYYAFLVVQGDYISAITSIFNTNQVGTGTQLALYDKNGFLLPGGIYSGTDVDNFMQGFTPTFVLPVPESNFTKGDPIAVGIRTPTLTTQPKILTAPGSSLAIAGLNLSTLRWGFSATYPTPPDSIPGSPSINAGLPFFGVL